MPVIDRAGTYTGTIVESTLGQSAKGYPQWQAKLKAEKLYANTKELIEHFKLEAPAYVDWSSYDETITAFLVLFNDNGPLKNYEQLQSATGWDGSDFQDLLSFVGKKILFRVEEEEYNGKTQLKVNWIDAEDAPPERTLKSVDAAGIAALNAKFLAGRAKPAAPAKPVKAAVAAPKPAPASPNAPAATGGTPAPASDAPVATATEGKSKGRPPGKKTPPPAAAPVDPLPAGLPAETTKDAAWEFLNEPAVRGGNDEGVVADAWIAACGEVGENVEEDKFTPAMWAKVRDTVLRDLGVTK